MLDLPKTKEEARKYRYGSWAGDPQGRRFVEHRCAYEVWSGFHSYQCHFKPGKGPEGLYCGIHAKKIKP